jgi:hypothetical protein
MGRTASDVGLAETFEAVRDRMSHPVSPVTAG